MRIRRNPGSVIEFYWKPRLSMLPEKVSINPIQILKADQALTSTYTRSSPILQLRDFQKDGFESVV